MKGPAEDIAALLKRQHPQQVIIGIGATRYTPFGEQNFLQPGDESIVVMMPVVITRNRSVRWPV